MNGEDYYLQICQQRLNRSKENLKLISSNYDNLNDIDAMIIGRHQTRNSRKLLKVKNTGSAFALASNSNIVLDIDI